MFRVFSKPAQIRVIAHASAVAVWLVVVMLMSATISDADANSAIKNLKGRWSGWGTVNMSNGTKEQVKCVATFFLENGVSDIRQNLRCASSSYKIDVRSDLKVSGSTVSGTWEERNHSNSGSISGRLSGSTFRMAITGPVLNAKMTLNSGRCKMNISITPTEFNVQQINIGLRKC